MSAFGGKADVIQGVAECPLLATSGSSTNDPKSPIRTIGHYLWDKIGGNRRSTGEDWMIDVFVIA